MSGYTIVNHIKIEDHITFIRINPDNLQLTLQEIFISLSDMSWLSNFDMESMQRGFRVRAESTLQNIHSKLTRGDTDNITSNSGETIVSELARKSIISELGYLDIPLAELFKQKKDGNPGFDFFSVNLEEIILYGEAKYVAKDNGYGRAFKQITDFRRDKKDESDNIDLFHFCSPVSLENSSNGKRGYVSAFSSTNMSTERLIKNIKENSHFQQLKSCNEIICVAVNV